MRSHAARKLYFPIKPAQRCIFDTSDPAAATHWA
jgi:hypothetical protein